MTRRKISPRIPVTLIAGFLGAGKTTLLNHILSGDHGVRAAVLVNDFGSINIDAKLIVGVEGDTVNLANGCVCCTIRDDLVGACLELLQRPERPEHLFVELSGVSDPVPVLNTFLETQLVHTFSFSSILSVVDAEQLPRLEGEMSRLARWHRSREIAGGFRCMYRNRGRLTIPGPAVGAQARAGVTEPESEPGRTHTPDTQRGVTGGTPPAYMTRSFL